jgi:hypothetical protein
VLDSSGRGSSITFTKRGLGDVLLNWENEALLALKQPDGGQYQIVYPSRSILAEPPVALVDVNVDKRGTRKAAEAFLNYLYTPQAQDIEAKNYYRPRDPQVLARYRKLFPDMALSTVDADFGGWTKAQADPFRQWRGVRPDLSAGEVNGAGRGSAFTTIALRPSRHAHSGRRRGACADADGRHCQGRPYFSQIPGSHSPGSAKGGSSYQSPGTQRRL